MIAENHASRKFAPLLKDLAEGRIARDTWLAWWQDHAPELERTLLPGWLLILKPRLNRTANETMAGAVAAASHILTAMEIEHATEDRYRVAAQAEHEARLAEIERKDLERAATFRTGIDAIKEVYPRFGRLLQRRIDLIT